MGKKSKSTKGSSEKANIDATFEQDAKKRKLHNQSHEESSQTDDTLEKNFQLEKIDGHVFQLEEELTQTKNQVNKLYAFIKEQQEQIDQEKYFRSVMSARLNDLEQYSRKNNVRVFGIPDADRREHSSKSEQLVLKLFKEKLGIHWITQNDIDIAHRTGSYSENFNRA